MSHVGLTLDALPAAFGAPGPFPRQPTLIPPEPGEPAPFATVAALAAEIQRLRRRGSGKWRRQPCGLQLQATRLQWCGSLIVPGFKVFLTPLDVDDGPLDYLCAIAVRGWSMEAVMAAIADAGDPDRRVAA